MELEHRFELPVTLETAWQALLDIERIGPCFPGATLDSVDGDDFTGSVKLNIGVFGLTYTGRATIVEKDPVAHRARIEASGNAARNASTAALLVTATATELTPSRTAVDLLTTLSITGREARFGRAVMIEVGNKLIGQFADCVSNELVGRPAGGAELIEVVDPDEVAAELVEHGVADDRAAVETTAGSAHRVPAPARPIDLVSTAGVPVLKRVLPIALGVIGLFLVRALFQRKPKPDSD